MPATFSPADSASSTSRQRGVYTRRKRRRSSSISRLGNKAVLGVLGALGLAFVVSLIIIAVGFLK